MTHYQTLGVAPSATAEQVRAAFLELSKQLHPDVRSDGEKPYRAVTAAYGVLKNPVSRATYDKELALTMKRCRTCEGKGVRWISQGFTRRTAAVCKECAGAGFTF